MNSADIPDRRHDVVGTITVEQSDRVCVDVRVTFARAYARYSWAGSHRADMAWNEVLDRLGWSIAYDLTHDTHLSSAEVDLFKRIDQHLMKRNRRRVEVREHARRGEKDPAAADQSAAATDRREGGLS
jgi:hypothetical protein